MTGPRIGSLCSGYGGLDMGVHPQRKGLGVGRMSRVWEIRLPWQAPPCSANDRDHWRVKARKVAEVRRAAVDGAVRAGLPVDAAHITVGLIYTPRDRRRRDPDNLVVPLFKALVDGLVDANVVADDTPQYVTRRFPVITAPSASPRLVLTVEVTT